MLPARTPPPGVFLSIVFWFCARETHHQVAWIATLLFSAVVVASVVLPIVYQKNIKLVYAPRLAFPTVSLSLSSYTLPPLPPTPPLLLPYSTPHNSLAHNFALSLLARLLCSLTLLLLALLCSLRSLSLAALHSRQRC